MSEFNFILNADLFKKGLSEQKAVLNDFWEKGSEILEGSGINIKPPPKKWFLLRHNYFSVLFIVVFFILKIPMPRLRFYARLDHCLRTWVTACDNLLDDELKELLITDLPEDARIFKSVHTILVADRIFFSFMIDAVREGTISEEEMDMLLGVSLSSISASGREEAEEERGVVYDLSPDDILYRIHSVKTGLLFTSPLSAPLALGDIDMNDPHYINIHGGLCSIALGCQILDDLSDIGMDLFNTKHNYLAALVLHGRNGQERSLINEILSGKSDNGICHDSSLYKRFPDSSKIAIDEATLQFKKGLDLLCAGGLPFNATMKKAFLKALMTIYDHPGLLMSLRE
jgi:hypothetical protein